MLREIICPSGVLALNWAAPLPPDLFPNNDQIEGALYEFWSALAAEAGCTLYMHHAEYQRESRLSVVLLAK